MSNLVRGAAVPLFDKLLVHTEGETGDFFLLSPTQLHASIGRELSRLLNTRSRLMPSQYALTTGTSIDYGIPDFSALSSQRQEDLELMAAGIHLAIGHYETRLKNVSVKVAEAPMRGNPTVVQIGGDVTIGLHVKRLSFELQLGGDQGSASGNSQARSEIAG